MQSACKYQYKGEMKTRNTCASHTNLLQTAFCPLYAFLSVFTRNWKNKSPETFFHPRILLSIRAQASAGILVLNETAAALWTHVISQGHRCESINYKRLPKSVHSLQNNNVMCQSASRSALWISSFETTEWPRKAAPGFWNMEGMDSRNYNKMSAFFPRSMVGVNFSERFIEWKIVPLFRQNVEVKDVHLSYYYYSSSY